MKCALWLCRRRVFSAEEIPASFDLAALRGYFLAGSLVEWLDDNGGAQFASQLRGLSESDPNLNQRIEEIFCGTSRKPNRASRAPKTPFVGCADIPAELARGTCGSGGSWGGLTSYKGFGGSGYEWTFGSFGRRGFGGSWNGLTSYKGFGGGSYERAFGSLGRRGFGGSWSGLTSYKGFGGGSYEWTFGSYFGSSFYRMQQLWERVLRWEQPTSGSFAGGFLPTDEYDAIMMLTLAKCPLDQYGYGIHILYD